MLPTELQDKIHNINQIYYANLIICTWKKRNAEIKKMLEMIEDHRTGWWHTNQDFDLMADDTEEGYIQYNMYATMYTNAGEYMDANARLCKYVRDNFYKQ